jgi:hypothetical protein
MLKRIKCRVPHFFLTRNPFSEVPPIELHAVEDTLPLPRPGGVTLDTPGAYNESILLFINSDFRTCGDGGLSGGKHIINITTLDSNYSPQLLINKAMSIISIMYTRWHTAIARFINAVCPQYLETTYPCDCVTLHFETLSYCHTLLP